MKPTPFKYFLHSLHVQLSGFHVLILALNTTKVSEFLISIGREFHINDPKYRNEFFPFKTLFTEEISKSACDLKLKL